MYHLAAIVVQVAPAHLFARFAGHGGRHDKELRAEGKEIRTRFSENEVLGAIHELTTRDEATGLTVLRPHARVLTLDGASGSSILLGGLIHLDRTNIPADGIGIRRASRLTRSAPLGLHAFKEDDENRWPPSSAEIEPKSVDGLVFKLFPYPVLHLIVEDWDYRPPDPAGEGAQKIPARPSDSARVGW